VASPIRDEAQRTRPSVAARLRAECAAADMTAVGRDQMTAQELADAREARFDRDPCEPAMGRAASWR
jgi:hypothetical protein